MQYEFLNEILELKVCWVKDKIWAKGLEFMQLSTLGLGVLAFWGVGAREEVLVGFRDIVRKSCAPAWRSLSACSTNACGRHAKLSVVLGQTAVANQHSKA